MKLIHTFSWLAFSSFLTASLSATDLSDQLHELYEAEWQRSLQEQPIRASALGDRQFDDRWPDRSLPAIADSHRLDQEVLAKLTSLSEQELSTLPAQERIHYLLFRRDYEYRVAVYPFGWHYVPLNQRGGIQEAGSLADSLSFQSVHDYENWIARMRAFPNYMNQTIALMREGIARRIIHSRVVMQRVPAQIAAQLVDNPRDQLFYKPFLRMHASVSEDEQRRLRSEAQEAIEDCILPSYQRFQKFFNNEYLPACFESVGVWQIPRGEELYRLRCREFTTTSLSPEEIHNIGLEEVARIRQEMEAIVHKVNFPGSFAEFLEFLRTDPQFYAADGQQLLRAYLELCKKVDPQLVKLFKRLPRMPYGVEAIPDHIAPDTTTGYYRPPAADGSRAGTFFVNIYRPEVRPLYEIEALSLHEAVPGHHLQIALAFELDDLPRFRRYGGYTAFVEGWALYAESLGGELGLYTDPYSKFGQLTYEMWRAVRLVVDTGIHHYQWDRQRAIDFFAANTAKAMHDIENEIDRYIAWPGQALAYKIGELKIQQLRKRATDELGEQFDVREFHDVVLRHGAITLDLLEQDVTRWIKDQQSH